MSGVQNRFCGGRLLHNMSYKIKAVLVDLSGTLHIEDTAIPGAQDALKRLRASSVRVKFVTNTTKEPLKSLHDRLLKLNFDLSRDEIFTSLTAARTLIVKKNVRPLLMLEDTAKEDFEGISTHEPNAVVVGLSPSSFNYEMMNTAFRLLLEKCPLIAVHKARYYKKADGLLYLGPGPFVAGLESATGSIAEVVGKPEKTFFHEAIRDLGVRPEDTVMIGDDARDDVEGAIQAGMMGILVKTGKYRVGDEQHISSQAIICNHFPAAVQYILNNL